MYLFPFLNDYFLFWILVIIKQDTDNNAVVAVVFEHLEKTDRYPLHLFQISLNRVLQSVTSYRLY